MMQESELKRRKNKLNELLREAFEDETSELLTLSEAMRLLGLPDEEERADSDERTAISD